MISIRSDINVYSILFGLRFLLILFLSPVVVCIIRSLLLASCNVWWFWLLVVPSNRMNYILCINIYFGFMGFWSNPIHWKRAVIVDEVCEACEIEKEHLQSNNHNIENKSIQSQAQRERETEGHTHTHLFKILEMNEPKKMKIQKEWVQTKGISSHNGYWFNHITKLLCIFFIFDLAFMVNRFVNGGQIKAIAFYCGDFYSACFSYCCKWFLYIYIDTQVNKPKIKIKNGTILTWLSHSKTKHRT